MRQTDGMAGRLVVCTGRMKGHSLDGCCHQDDGDLCPPASITGVHVPELLNGRLKCPKELVDVTPLWINSLFLGKWDHYFLNWNLGKHLERSFL